MDVNLGAAWRIAQDWFLILVGQTRLGSNKSTRTLARRVDNVVGQIQKISCCSKLGSAKSTVGFRMTVKVTSTSGTDKSCMYEVASKHMKEKQVDFPQAASWKKLARAKKDGACPNTLFFFSCSNCVTTLTANLLSASPYSACGY